MELEKVFTTMGCIERFATYTYVGRIRTLLRRARRLLEVKETPITWETFPITFLDNYFSDGLENEKEKEFLHLH